MMTSEEHWIYRQISIYEKDGEKCLGEIPLNEIKLQDLLELLTLENSKDDYLLYDCYLLNEVMLKKLSELTNKYIKYDLIKYQYYLEANSK